MQNQSPRETWRAEAERQGIPLGVLAKRTGITRRAIYAYSSGSRRPSDAWIERVWSVLRAMDAVQFPEEATA
jgi:predicted transcriptional regulator